MCGDSVMADRDVWRLSLELLLCNLHEHEWILKEKKIGIKAKVCTSSGGHDTMR